MTERRRRSAQRGFVLVMVLALLVVLTILATAVATSASRAVAAAQADVDRFEGELDMLGTRETVLLMLATQRLTVAGMTVNESDAQVRSALEDMEDRDGFSGLPVGNEIRLDATPYNGLGNAQFALQDDRGLLSVNWAPPAFRQRFYESRGVPADQWQSLEAKRLDYQDADDLHRLNGAESPAYRQYGLPPPTNRTLSTPLELRRILQWNEVLADTDDAELLGIFTMARGADINLNTAPVEVLQLIPGVSAQTAERMVALRRPAPFTSALLAQSDFALPDFLEEGLALFAKPSGNLILWDRRAGAKLLSHWAMTPYADGGPPWRIDYEVIFPRGNESDPAVAGTPATPLFTPQDTTRTSGPTAP